MAELEKRWKEDDKEEREKNERRKSVSLSIDLHVHTIYSNDGILKPEKVIGLSMKKGLDGIAITDHNTIRGGVETKKKAPKDFLVIVGSEIKTNKGDLTGLFLRKEIESRDFKEVVGEIKSQDGIVVLPHPTRNKYVMSANEGELRELLDDVDFVESLNGRSSRAHNNKAKEFAQKYSKPEIGGSDAHIGAEIGSVRTLFEGSNSLSIKQNLLQRQYSFIGKETPYLVRIASIIVGKYRRGGLIGLARCTKKKLSKTLI